MNLPEAAMYKACFMKSRFLHRYPWKQHVLALLPTFVGISAMVLILGDEQGVGGYIAALRETRPDLTRLADQFCDYGIIPFHALYVVFLAVGLARGKRSLVVFALAYLASLLLAIVAVDILKYAIGRPRPYHPTSWLEPFSSDNDFHSFPSGHVADGLVAVIPLAQRFGKTVLPLALGLFPFFMALARIQMLHHHPSDVLGSLVIGSIGAIVARFAYARLAMYRRLRVFVAGRKNPAV